MKFSENLIKLRKNANLSQEELGEKLGVARQTISKWENSETTPELDKLYELSKIFEISIDELVGNKITKTIVTYKNHKNYYEYVSKTKIGQIPLVHINIGYGIGNFRTAKGIFAFGNIAKGVFSLGVISYGIVALGVISLGIISLGCIALALFLSIGCISIGSIAIGAFALGFLAVGGLAIGIYAIGGCAIAKDIATGGYANGYIAIGDYVDGTITYLSSEVSSETSNEIKKTILQEFPNIWKIIASIFSKAGL